VIADSELPANHALAESLTAIGLPTSFEESLAWYCGHNWQETSRRIEVRLGGPLPEDFRASCSARVRAAFAEGLDPVRGVEAFIDRILPLPRAIASSSQANYIGMALDRFGLATAFGPHIYSADGMARGKPHPDIYLMAARGLDVDPARCLAIEDSPIGATAAVAAGMRVVGLCAAAHIADPQIHAARLRAVGVHHIAFSFEEIAL
jgi:HAD superfamily hydrolase (TIGR01509 family)